MSSPRNTARPPYPGAPGWVKVFGSIVLVVTLLFIVLLLTHGGARVGHGLGRHSVSFISRLPEMQVEEHNV
jgi:hypothetical protein